MAVYTKFLHAGCCHRHIFFHFVFISSLFFQFVVGRSELQEQELNENPFINNGCYMMKLQHFTALQSLQKHKKIYNKKDFFIELLLLPFAIVGCRTLCCRNVFRVYPPSRERVTVWEIWKNVLPVSEIWYCSYIKISFLLFL